MSEGVRSAEEKAAEQRRGPRPGGGPPHLRMGMPTERSANFGPVAKRVLGLLAPERRMLGLAFVLGTVGVVLTALGPKVLAGATDLIFAGAVGRQLPAGASVAQVVAGLRSSGQNELADLISHLPGLVPGRGIDFGAVGRILLIVLVLYLVAAVFSWAQGLLVLNLVNRTVFRLRRTVEAKLHRLPLPYFDGQPRGEVLSRVTNDIDNVSQSLQQTLSQLISAVLTVVAMLIMMFYISWMLALIALVTIPLSLLLTAAIGKRSQRHFLQQWKSTGELNAIVEETFSGHGLVKVYNQQRGAQESFQEKNSALYRAGFGAQFISGVIMPSLMFIGNLNYVAIAVVGGLRVASGQMTLGDVQAFVQYSRQFTQPLTQAASMANLAQSGVASAERVFELLDTPEQAPDSPAGTRIVDPRGEVAFEDVSFSYRPDRPLIDHLDLVVHPGQTVAIVGPTGAGKTTLVNLIMRFYELDGGRITIDGVDITSLRRHDLRALTGMVLQDTWLFSGSIRDNIAYSRPDASEEDIMVAARATFVDRFVRSLPDGYDTMLDAEAGNVSAGEKQLLTIARAFLADPALLILDEATSSVDTRTEALVQRAMNALRTDRTSFVIAHRLSTIRDADIILVMEQGHIVEQGTHADLLERGGAYTRLYRAQFTRGTDDGDDHGVDEGADAGSDQGVDGSASGSAAAADGTGGRDRISAGR